MNLNKLNGMAIHENSAMNLRIQLQQIQTKYNLLGIKASFTGWIRESLPEQDRMAPSPSSLLPHNKDITVIYKTYDRAFYSQNIYDIKPIQIIIIIILCIFTTNFWPDYINFSPGSISQILQFQSLIFYKILRLIHTYNKYLSPQFADAFISLHLTRRVQL